MRTFVFRQGKTQRFWTIGTDEVQNIVVSSAESGPGTVEPLTFADRTQTRSEYDRLIAGKLAEGYVETTGDPWHGGFESQLRRSLEDAIGEDPDDPSAHMAYADHLMELGDPRGEFIQVQLALGEESLPKGQRKKLQKREATLLARHERTWLGPMAAYWIDKLDQELDGRGVHEEPHQLTWRRGWIDSLGLQDGSRAAVQAALTRRPLLNCLRDLRVYWIDYNNDGGCLDLLEADCFAHVRTFQVGHNDDQCFLNGEVPVERYLEKMPVVEELYLYDRSLPFHCSLPHLRKLTAYHAPEEYDLEELAANRTLKNLTHLACWPCGQINEEPEEPNSDGGRAYITRSGAAALFRSRNFPGLQHLQLRNSDIGDEGIQILIESGRLRRLRTLDLLGGCITDAGANLLAACPDLPNLEALNLSENMLTDAGIAVLRATGVNLTADAQNGPDALQTGAYLWSGDSE
jgi:uncharacterized protein (TIGR02996 family)